MSAPPLFVLGVSRSGTTLLRVILDRSPGIAIPDETFFIPQLAHRHGGTVDPTELLDDLRRLPRLAAWDVPAEKLALRLRQGMRTGEAIAAVFSAYADKHGKPRWGDKTPMNMRHLGLIDELFPDAQYVHLIRDGRDAALAFLDMPEGVVTKTWAHPRSPAGFACEWRTEVRGARALGSRVGPSRFFELRYEDLVADTEGAIRAVCDFAALPFEPAMLEYAGAVDVSAKPHHQRLLQPPTRGVRDWRSQMSAGDVAAFERIAGDLLAELGYEVRGRAGRAVFALAWYRLRMGAWNTVAYAIQRSPLWRRRHPRLF
ncbi:MAG TPA: sulfotransferase [Gaiellaceae bacterium]|nr:sulfotransferase [Gaiellaceae bacterium]